MAKTRTSAKTKPVAKTKAAPAKKAAVAKKAAPAKKAVAKKKASAKTAAPAKKTAVAKTKPSARERGVTVDAYIAGLSDAYRSIAASLVALVKEVVPKATASIKWGQPVFEHGGPMIWMKAFAKHFGFGFWRGAELPDPKGILQGEGDRMRHVKLRDAKDVDAPALRALVRAAAAANQTKGDPTKRR